MPSENPGRRGGRGAGRREEGGSQGFPFRPPSCASRTLRGLLPVRKHVPRVRLSATARGHPRDRKRRSWRRWPGRGLQEEAVLLPPREPELNRPLPVIRARGASPFRRGDAHDCHGPQDLRDAFPRLRRPAGFPPFSQCQSRPVRSLQSPAEQHPARRDSFFCALNAGSKL